MRESSTEEVLLRSIPRTQLAVMRALLDERSHAYEIKRRLAAELGHSSVYAALAGAEAKGYLASAWEDPTARPPGSGPLRKYYELTAIGSAALQAHEATTASVSARETNSQGATDPVPGIRGATA